MAKEKQPESGQEILEALMQGVTESVQGKVKRAPNKSKTYTRLQVDGRTFAYVFPPAPARLAVKIPKQLLAVETSLPRGHGFKKTKWGLTRTLTTKAEAAKAAQALAVAAREAVPQEA